MNPRLEMQSDEKSSQQGTAPLQFVTLQQTNE